MSDGQIGNEMRDALRRFAKGVAVVTARAGDGHMAMAATAVCELSLDPPSMLVCVNQGASMHGALSAGSPFCINILHASHGDISSACGGRLKGEERFGLGTWVETDLGVRRLADAQASFLCVQAKCVDFGSHSIFIGEVQGVFTDRAVDPLVYVDGGYRGLDTSAPL